MSNSLVSNSTKKAILIIAGLTVALFASMAFAGGQDITALTTKVKTQATAIAQLLNVAAYVAGVGFALAGVLQFKAHKDNPQQTPLSKPVVMIVVAACLLFLPTVLDIAGESLFESGKSSLEFEAGQ